MQAFSSSKVRMECSQYTCSNYDHISMAGIFIFSRMHMLCLSCLSKQTKLEVRQRSLSSAYAGTCRDWRLYALRLIPRQLLHSQRYIPPPNQQANHPPSSPAVHPGDQVAP